MLTNPPAVWIHETLYKMTKKIMDRGAIANNINCDEMIACHGENCAIEWFHLSRVNFTEAEIPTTNWYCPDCVNQYIYKSCTPQEVPINTG